MFQHLLVPTDGSAHAFTAASLAPRLLAPGGTVTLLHAASSFPALALAGADAAAVAISGTSSELAERGAMEREREAAAVLAEARGAIPTAVSVETVAVEGRAADLVLDALEAPDVDGLVVGSRGRGMLARALLGSVSDMLVRHAHKPVVVARRETLRSILLAADGSESSARAARLAGEIARAHDLPVTLLHAIEFPIDTFLTDRVVIDARLRTQAHVLLEPVRAALGPVRLTERVIFHEPAHAILTTAERTGADLVVVGRRGPAPSRRTTIGSVSLRVSMNAVGSVLVVP